MTDDELRGWKEIATFLGTSRRSAQRWEAEFGLPVHRLGGQRGTVYALKAELSLWRESKTRTPADADPQQADAEGQAAPTAGPEGRSEDKAQEDAHSTPSLPAMFDSVEDARPGMLASGMRAVRPRTWGLLALVVALVALTAGWSAWPGTSREEKAIPGVRHKIPLIPLQLTMPNGMVFGMHLREGVAGNLDVGGRHLLLTARRTPDGLRVTIDEVGTSAIQQGKPVLVGEAVLRDRGKFTLNLPGALTIEEARPPSNAAASKSRP